MNQLTLPQALELILVIRNMQEVLRATPKRNGLFENNAEHTYMMMFLALLLAPHIEQEFGQKLDMKRVYELSLIHDIAEIVTGDIPTWETLSPEVRADKGERERFAVEHLLVDVPAESKEYLLDLWQESEDRQTLEAKFVKSLDRMDPALHRIYYNIGFDNVPDNGQGSPLDQMIARQMPRHEFSETMKDFYGLVVEKIRATIDK